MIFPRLSPPREALARLKAKSTPEQWALWERMANEGWGDDDPLGHLDTPLVSSAHSWGFGIGYWFSPSGILYPVDTDHDTYVSQNSDLFGAVSEEGAIEKGWCRVRFHPSGLEIDVSSNGQVASPQRRVSSAAVSLQDRGISLRGKSINVGVDNLPGVSLTDSEALSGDWEFSPLTLRSR